MYAFSLMPTGRKVDPDAASPQPKHVIRSPAEMRQLHTDEYDDYNNNDNSNCHRVSSPQNSSRASERSAVHPIRQHRAGSSNNSSVSSTPPPQPQQQQQQQLFAASASSCTPLKVHNVSAYTDMRDAADWSAAVQREKLEKRQHALAIHEAAKKEEQRRREAAEMQSRRELQRRHEERRQLRAAQREQEELAHFQDHNTQFLRNQQRLIDLGASMAHAQAQRKARAKEEMYTTWTATRAGTTSNAFNNTNSKTGAGNTVSSCKSLGFTAVPSSRFAAPILMTMATATTPAAAPPKEIQLRQTAQHTEDTYVQLSLAYRNEAYRSRAAASILAGAAVATDARYNETSVQPERNLNVASGLASSSANTAPASIAPLPFRTAPPMYSHDSVEHMGRHADAIPMTYIPEYFEDGRGTGHMETATMPAHQTVINSTTEVMPLPLRPAPVSRAVSDTLRDIYYPWVTLADGQSTSATKPATNFPSRETYLPVRRWGSADLQASIYGHYTNPDGTMRESCERRKEFAEYLNYTSIPHDNATATSNSPESVVPFRPGKRQEVWL